MLAVVAGSQTYYWEYFASQPAGGLANYSFVAATTSDSLPNSNPYTAFMIQARAPSQWWYSDPDSGYSVDNISPPAPAGLSGTYANEATSLLWRSVLAPDLAGYRIYRGGPGFVPAAENLIATVAETTFVDNTPGGFVFKVSSLDQHGNESGHVEVTPSGTTSVGPTAIERPAQLAPPRPNPLRTETTFHFTLSRESRVRLALFDPNGRRVATLEDGLVGPGDHGRRWDGTDHGGRPVADGIYFAVLVAGGSSTSRTVVVMR
jgi:hypothetical protein